MNDATLVTIINGAFETLNAAMTKLPELAGMFRRKEVEQIRRRFQDQLARLGMIAGLAEKHRNSLLYAQACAAGYALIDKSKEHLVAVVLRYQTSSSTRITKDVIVHELQRAVDRINDAREALRPLPEIRHAAEFIALHATSTGRTEIEADVTSVEDSLRALRGTLASMITGISQRGSELHDVGLTMERVVSLYDPVKDPLVKLQAILMASVRNEFGALMTGYKTSAQVGDEKAA